MDCRRNYLRSVFRRQSIPSFRYLNSILKILVEAGHLVSLRGKGGGYRLASSPDAYRVGDILRLVEGNLAAVACVQESHQCPNIGTCRSYSMWRELDQIIAEYLDSVTLADLLPGGRLFDPE